MKTVIIRYLNAEQLSMFVSLNSANTDQIVETIRWCYPVSRSRGKKNESYETTIQVLDIPRRDIQLFGSSLDKTIVEHADKIVGYDLVKSMINDDEEDIKGKLKRAIHSAAHDVLCVEKFNVVFYGNATDPARYRSSIPKLIDQVLCQDFHVCDMMYRPYDQSNRYVVELIKEEKK